MQWSVLMINFQGLLRKNPLVKFLSKFLHGNAKYDYLWKVCKIVPTLSHGQTSAECGFSVNKEASADIQEELSLISQRCVYHNVKGFDIAVCSISKEIEKHQLFSLIYKDAQIGLRHVNENQKVLGSNGSRRLAGLRDPTLSRSPVTFQSKL